jgi:hypothetical protein
MAEQKTFLRGKGWKPIVPPVGDPLLQHFLQNISELSGANLGVVQILAKQPYPFKASPIERQSRV